MVEGDRECGVSLRAPAGSEYNDFEDGVNIPQMGVSRAGQSGVM